MTTLKLTSAETPAVPPPVPPTPAAAGVTPIPAGSVGASGAPILEATGLCSTDREIEIRAASRTLTVSILDEERRLIRRSAKANSPEAELLDRVLGYRIAVQVNEQAGAAVVAWNDLQLAIAGLHAAERSLAVVEEAGAEQDRAEELGLITAGGDAERADLQRQRAELAAAIAAGEATLAAMIGDPLPMPVPPTMLPAPPSAGESISLAMTVRPELNVLRAVIAELDAKTLPVAIGVLQQSEPASGTMPRSKFWPFPSEDEIAARRRQLCAVLSRQEQAVVAQVESAVDLLQGLEDQFHHANDAVAKRAADLQRLEARRGVATDVDAVQVTEARLALIAAEAERDRLAFESHKGWARLRAAQGLPAVDSGYLSPPPGY